MPLYSSLSVMHWRAVTCLIALAAIQSQTAGELVIAPRNTESKVGETAYFNCSTDLKSSEIFWHHGDKYIYNGNVILEPYNGRFEIDRDTSIGSQNLVIHSVQSRDAGEYICIDDDGSGKKQSAELVVLDDDPDCKSNIQPEGVIGQNVFNIPADEVNLTCNVTYNGNIPPQMEWKKVGDSNSIQDNVTSSIRSNKCIVYTLKLKGDIALQNSSYLCQTTRSTQMQYNCSSDIIKVLYFFGGDLIEISAGKLDNITCNATNSSFSCIRQWYQDNYTCPYSCRNTIQPYFPGKYLCTVKCHVRGKDYYFEAMKVSIVAETESSLWSDILPSIAALVVLAVIIILPILIAVFAVRRKRRKFKRRIRRLRERLSEDKERGIELLLARASFVDSDEPERTNVAKKEVELLYKLTKERKPGHEGIKPIAGFAILSGKLFIVRNNTCSSVFEVYNNCDFSLGHKLLKLKECVTAFDMCSCKRNNCLYIMNDNSNNKKILKFNKDGKLLKKWSTNKHIGNLSATSEGNVMITVLKSNILLEYSPNGILQSEVKLPKCINPWHAIKRDDRYIVSHGVYLDDVHRVCIVDKEGFVDMSFGGEKGSKEIQLKMPFYLAIGSNGCVIVVDHCNDRVLLLDSNLNFKAIIVPKHNQRFLLPTAVHLDENRLVVGIIAGDPRNPTPKEEGTFMEGGVSKENKDLMTKLGSNIEKDCELLVFNIESLLKKNNDYVTI